MSSIFDNEQAQLAKTSMIDEIVVGLSTMPKVTAIAITGSIPAGTADAQSDVDIYVLGPEPPPSELRLALAQRYDPVPEIGNNAFGLADEWIDRATGVGVDVGYFATDWLEDQIARVLDRHLASVGYTTCFWRTVRQSRSVYDPTGWFAQLQTRAQQPYPEPLRRAIVALNYPLLRAAHSSYLHQIERAIDRDDSNSVLHRTSALLVSYFDILFALNRVPHPGEKRLVAFAERECPLRPVNLGELIQNVVSAVTQARSEQRLVSAITTLVDSLDTLLSDEELLDKH